MKKLLVTLLSMLFPAMLTGCYYLQDTEVPIPLERTYASGNAQKPAKEVLILLPGIGDYAAAYSKRGFIDIFFDHNHAQDIDVIAVNAHFKYYQDRSLLVRLKEDVIDLAKAQGYERIHLGGISLGGFGSLLYLREYPQDITSVIIFAPYLGEDQHRLDFLQWQRDTESAMLEPNNSDAISTSPTTTSTSIDDDGNLWPWLTTLDPASKAKITLLYGLDDKFKADNDYLASLLSDEQVFTASGGHSWPTWNNLWAEFLSSKQSLSE